MKKIFELNGINSKYLTITGVQWAFYCLADFLNLPELKDIKVTELPPPEDKQLNWTDALIDIILQMGKADCTVDMVKKFVTFRTLPEPPKEQPDDKWCNHTIKCEPGNAIPVEGWDKKGNPICNKCHKPIRLYPEKEQHKEDVPEDLEDEVNLADVANKINEILAYLRSREAR